MGSIIYVGGQKQNEGHFSAHKKTRSAQCPLELLKTSRGVRAASFYHELSELEDAIFIKTELIASKEPKEVAIQQGKKQDGTEKVKTDLFQCLD